MSFMESGRWDKLIASGTEMSFGDTDSDTDGDTDINGDTDTDGVI